MKAFPALALLISIALSAPVNAEELTGRLKRIKDVETLIIGYRETSIPFSYVVSSGPIGFGVDISKRIAESIQARLGIKELQLRWNPMTLATRFPLMVTNTIDIECTTTTNTRARQNMVAFSNTFFISDEGIASRREAGFKSIDELAGKRVAVVRGATTEMNLAARHDINLVAEPNNTQAMTALMEGRADAYVAAAPLIAGEMLRLPDASSFVVISHGGYREAFGCMLPKDDKDFKQLVDEAIAGMMASGEIRRLYDKWFMTAIPPLGRKANLPLSEENYKLHSAPNDNPLE